MKQCTYEKKFFYPLIPPIFFTLFTIICVLLMMPAHSIFGSEGDWFSQHAAIAEQFRTIFYETGRIFPDVSLLGAGSNIYDLSYYGFLRPDVFISFFLPKVPMTYIISVYAILELITGTNLCYYWLKRHVDNPFFAFLGGILFSCAACFYHAHHQIMFVNYMPFLILALWGVERLITQQKKGLLILSLFLVYLHSYYFAPAVLVVCTLYFIHCLYWADIKSVLPGAWRNFICSIALSIGMAAILLLPTALDLLSTQKDAGTPASLQEICSVNLSMEALLYHPYGCGLTLLCLYTLFLSIRRRNTRLLGIFLLLCLTVNALPYLLSGLLYIRYKVLIPLVPLLILLCVRTLEELFTGRETHSLFCALGCLIPAAFSDYPQAILLDSLWMLIVFFLIYFCQRAFYQKNLNTGTLRMTFLLCLLLCLPSVLLSVIAGQQEDYISAQDNRQNVFTQEELQALKLDKRYRFDCLTEPFANVNVQPLQGIGRTAMYSSVTDSGYAAFFYDTMKNPVRIRNRVALMTDANPFFSYLMGIRYIQTDKSYLPWGYKSIAEKGTAVIAENTQVLPIAYTSTAYMKQSEYDKLAFPYNLEALTRYTIIPDDSSPDNSETTARARPDDASEQTTRNKRTSGDLETAAPLTAETFLENTRITQASIHSLITEEVLKNILSKQNTNDIQRNSNDTYTLSLKKELRLTLPLSAPLEHKLLICSFGVNAPTGDEITIDINGTRNKLSGKTAPYPNHNDTFTYLLSSNEAIQKLKITLSPGNYTLSDFKLWTMDISVWGNTGVHSIPFETQKENALLYTTADLNENTYFVTSFPFRKGYEIYVDGEKISASRVNQEFVGFPLDAGTHEIFIFYSPPGKSAAAIISLLSILLFFLTISPKLPVKQQTD